MRNGARSTQYQLQNCSTIWLCHMFPWHWHGCRNLTSTCKQMCHMHWYSICLLLRKGKQFYEDDCRDLEVNVFEIEPYSLCSSFVFKIRYNFGSVTSQYRRKLVTSSACDTVSLIYYLRRPAGFLVFAIIAVAWKVNNLTSRLHSSR